MKKAVKDEAAPLDLVATNRKAFHDFAITDKVEAGLVLKGTEVKSLRAKRCNLKDSHARVDQRGNMDLMNFHISPYEQGNRSNVDPTRTRRLLMHKRQIFRLRVQLQEKGMALVPLRVYFRNGVAKMELGLGKGKNVRDKREDLKKRAADMDVRVALREKNRRG